MSGAMEIKKEKKTHFFVVLFLPLFPHYKLPKPMYSIFLFRYYMNSAGQKLRQLLDVEKGPRIVLVIHDRQTEREKDTKSVLGGRAKKSFSLGQNYTPHTST